MRKSKRHTLKWFKDRIGKKVYRNDTKMHTVRVASVTHAKYLEMVQNDLDLYYSDKPMK